MEILLGPERLTLREPIDTEPTLTLRPLGYYRVDLYTFTSSISKNNERILRDLLREIFTVWCRSWVHTGLEPFPGSPYVRTEVLIDELGYSSVLLQLTPRLRGRTSGRVLGGVETSNLSRDQGGLTRHLPHHL